MIELFKIYHLAGGKGAEGSDTAGFFFAVLSDILQLVMRGSKHRYRAQGKGYHDIVSMPSVSMPSAAC